MNSVPTFVPASTVGAKKYNDFNVNGGQTGIRTLETVTRLHTFQACAFDHSATCP